MFTGLFPLLFLFARVIDGGTLEKPLSAEEEKYHLEEFAKGSPESKNILIARNMRLVRHVAKKYRGSVSDFEEACSIGNLGLMKAVLSYRLDKGVKFATYASKCIENEILMHIRSAKKHTTVISIHSPIGVDKEGNEITIENKLADDSDSVDELVYTRIAEERLKKAIDDELTPRERHIILSRNGLDGYEEKTQRELARNMRISRSYVSRIEKKAKEKLADAVTRGCAD